MKKDVELHGSELYGSVENLDDRLVGWMSVFGTPFAFAIAVIMIILSKVF